MDVTDVRSNVSDQIANAAKLLRRSEHRRRVFKEIYRGKAKVKTVNDIATRTRLSQIRVLQEGRILADHQIVKVAKVAGKTAYQKDRFFSQNRDRILSLALNSKKLEAFPTKVNPQRKGARDCIIRLPRKQFRIKRIIIADIDAFKLGSKVRTNSLSPKPIPEARFKKGVQRLIGERGRFQDWGGETSDLFTTRLKVAGRRMHAAFGFKGKGLRGILTLRNMGANGDQVYRLFREAADVFIVQHWRQIHGGILQAMEQLATAKSATTGNTIYYGVIDGNDTSALVAAYPKKFR